MLDDYDAVIESVKEENEVDNSNIFVMGWSTGAYLSMITAYNNPDVTGCILSGTASSFEEVIPILIERFRGKKSENNLLVPEDFPREQMPGLIAPNFKKAIKLIVGTKDDRTPPWMSQKIYDSLPDKIYKKLSVFENAGHGGTEAPYFAEMQRWIEETIEFMQEGKNKGE